MILTCPDCKSKNIILRVTSCDGHNVKLICQACGVESLKQRILSQEELPKLYPGWFTEIPVKLPLSREAIITRLKECQANGDTECAHSDADNILCEFLEGLGYSDIVSEYHAVEKWFA